jgi:hypothetical protein
MRHINRKFMHWGGSYALRENKGKTSPGRNSKINVFPGHAANVRCEFPSAMSLEWPIVFNLAEMSLRAEADGMYDGIN